MTVLEQLLPGLWTWTAVHPDWEGPESNWDAAVRGYLAFADDARCSSIRSSSRRTSPRARRAAPSLVH